MSEARVDWLAKRSTAAERVWWERVERAARKRHAGPGVPKVLSDWGLATLRVIGATRELVDGRLQAIPPERLTEAYKQTEISRLADQLGRRLGVGPPPELATIPVRPHLNLRELTDDELAELEEIAARVEGGEV